MQNNILILSTPEDPHFKAVDWVLRGVGLDPYLAVGNHFPVSAGWSLNMSNNRLACDVTTHDGRQIDLLDMNTVWYRRFHWPVISEGLAECDRSAALREAEEFVGGIYSIASSVQRWVNDPNAQAIANHKPLQLAIAQSIGMSLPNTLISNNVDEIRHFFAAQGGRAIYKAMGAMHWIAPDMHSVQFANLVEFSDFEDAQSLSLVPSIFQGYIEKAYEARVIAIGDVLNACKLDSQAIDGANIDWRLENSSKLGADILEIPLSVRKHIYRYMERTRLEYGAFDFIINKAGEWIFLECNTSGQFLFLEEWNPSLKLLATFCLFLCRNLNLTIEQRQGLQEASVQGFIKYQSNHKFYDEMANASNGRPVPRSWNYER